MPITFAHPAAVLPLVRRFGKGGWVACLLVGSMAPDLVQTFWPTRLPHSLVGLFLLDTPAAFLLGWCLQALLRNRLPSLPGWKGEIPGTLHIGWGVSGAFIGCSTHLAWDLFTHSDSVPVVRFLMHHQEVLSRIGFSESGPARFLQALWYLNSVLGLVSIAIFARAAIRPRMESFSRIPWKPFAIAGAIPFLPLVVEVPVRLIVGEGTPLHRLVELSTTLRMDTLLSPILVLVVFLMLTDKKRRRATASGSGP